MYNLYNTEYDTKHTAYPSLQPPKSDQKRSVLQQELDHALQTRGYANVLPKPLSRAYTISTEYDAINGSNVLDADTDSFMADNGCPVDGHTLVVDLSPK
jgi:hypothetical protein